MADIPPHVRLAQAAAILLATSTGSLNAGLSLFAVPRILDSPSPKVVTEQWGRMFHSSRVLFSGPMILLPGLINVFLAYALPAKSRWYITIAATTFSLFPWTEFVMSPVNWKMERRLRQTQAYGDGCGPLKEELSSQGVTETPHSVVQLWGSRNLFPCAVIFASGCAGLYAALT